VILPDVNVLVYAHRTDSAHHTGHAGWLARAAEGQEPIALTSMTVAGFTRIVTHPRIFPEPATPHEAHGFIEALIESPLCRWLEPSDRWWSIFVELCRHTRARGNVVPDAALAALALESGCRLATADAGFARFPRLQWFHPV
jgi:toxin-antitoxin system PIN domain toxin